ncbi:hypothetical protein GCM10009839_42160 [Catenulispora yoronensis]|uniref:DUF3159 domain-containing protein n=1 Tax=Catenulispora yoronensis TaxID=450799 RepID=A0ABP5G386_9ACTN
MTAATVSASTVAATTSASEPPAPPHPLKQALLPLAVDIAVPLGGYYLLHSAFGIGTAAALGITSVVPAVRTVAAVVVKREANMLAILMLAVNLAAIALTFVSGDARLMIAKDSAISSVIGLGILWSVRAGRPAMTAGLKPFVTKGNAQRVAAWEAIHEDAAFRAKENQYSLIWGVALVSECVARLVLAFTLAPSTMAWLGTVLLLAAIGAGCVLGGAAVEPIEKLIAARIEAESALSPAPTADR